MLAEGDAGNALTEPQRTALDMAWRQFGAASSPAEFCQRWLELQCRIISGVHSAIAVLQKPGGEGFAPFAAWPEGRQDRALAEITERALREGRGLMQAAPQGANPDSLPDQPDYHLAYPVRLDGAVRGVVALAIGWREPAALQSAMRQLQWGSGWLEVLMRRHADPMEAARLRIKLILQLVAAFLERPDLEEAATDVATEIAARLGCERVVLGLAEGAQIRIAAVSHATQFDRRANLLNCISAAMLEALDQRETIAFPQDRDARPVVTLAHAELARVSGAGGIATVPLRHKGRQVGALCLERAAGLHFDAATLELLEGLASMLGPLTDLRLDRQKTLSAHAASSARGFWSRLVGPKHAGLKLAAGSLAFVLLFLAVATGSYRISSHARIEGEVQRALTAPFQGYVRETARRAGDTVKKGELLARLDDRDLRLEHTRLTAQLDQLGRQYREAMAKRDRALAGVVSSQSQQGAAQLALVEEQLARTDVLAPFEGVLLSGDLTQALGSPLERGQTLFEIAPLDAYRVVLQVDEQRVADVKVGQRGELVLASMPGQTHKLSVTKITPVSIAREGRNYFRVEAQLDAGASARLRPGMEGVAKVAVEDRRLAWIWTRELLNWIRLKAWAWTP